MKKSSDFSPSEANKLAEESAAAAKPAALLPDIQEVGEAFRMAPTPQEDGTLALDVPMDPRTVEGKRALGLMAEMMAPSWRAQSERAGNVRGRRPKARIRMGAKTREVAEEHAERAERHHHRPRASIIVPEMPWKRRAPEIDDEEVA